MTRIQSEKENHDETDRQTDRHTHTHTHTHSPIKAKKNPGEGRLVSGPAPVS